MSWLYNQAPIWLLAPILLLLLIAAMTVGSAIRKRGAAAGPDGEEPGTSLVISAILGLLALLLGFTFALAVDRFDNRRSLVLQEANAIGTTYLRAQLLDEPHRARLSALLRGYTENRLALADDHDAAQLQALLRETDTYHRRLWEETVAAIRPIRDSEIAPTFVESMNATIDIGAERKAGRRAYVPNRVLTVLVIYMTVTALALGYALPDRRTRRATGLLLGLLAMAFLLILDLDRPTRGGIRESQMPMRELLESMTAVSAMPLPPGARQIP